MRLFGPLLLLAALALVGCASDGGREIASENNCVIERHKNSELYRITIKGRPFNKFWYKKSDAMGIMERLSDKGKCE